MEKPKKCLHCGNTSFFLDYDEFKCRICGRAHRPEPVSVEYFPEKKERRDYQQLTSQERADQRYRETELYRETRKKHQKKYRESEKGREAKQRHTEKEKILSRLVDRLIEKGWIV